MVDGAGDVVVRDRVATPPRDVWPALHRLVRRVVAARPDDVDVLERCGVSCEGPIDAVKGTVSPLHLRVWESFELRERVGELTGLPTVLGPTAQGRVLAECWKGAGRDIDDVMVLLLSDAVEAGVICNGRLLHGRLGNAGQLGHVVVEPDGLPCVCGGTGCLTAYASMSAIEEETNRPLRRAPASVIERTGMMVGRAVASAVAVFDLSLVVLTGAVPAAFGQTLLDAARRELDQRSRLAHVRAGARPQRAPGADGVHDARARGPARRRRRAGPLEHDGDGGLARTRPARRGPGAPPPFSTLDGREPHVRPRGRRLPRQGPGVPRREAAERTGAASASCRTTRSLDFVASWRTTLYEAGYLAPGWPVEYGGAGLTALEQVILAEEFAKAGVPMGGPNDGFGIQMLGNTLLVWGTEEQKQHYLPRILSGEDTWCQGYSEPNAGSDLGSLALEAQLDGDQWILNGQKIWTSAGHLADHIFTLARTDPDAPKHKGISFLLVDMRQPGIEVRPIRMISGESEFNEVFYTDATCPKHEVVGGVNNGWAVAMSLLGYERGAAAATNPIHYQAELDRLILLAKERGLTEDPIIRQRLAWCYGKVAMMRYLGMRVLTQFLNGHQPGPDAAITKLYWSEYHQAATELALDILGAEATVPSGRKPTGAFGTDDAGAPNSTASWVDVFLNTRAATIYAGSCQIQRNILGEMVLGLPKEPKRSWRRRRPSPQSIRVRRGRAAGTPTLWPVAVRQWRRTTPTGWWRRWPFLPVPSREYLRFRVLTQYGDSETRASGVDVVNYLAWCRTPAVRRRP